MRYVLAPFFWLGRVLLWVVCWPLGLWRSVRHGRKKSERRILAEIQRQRAE